MGHQINFFLGPCDLVELETRLTGAGDLIILHSRSPKPEAKVVQSVKFTEDGKQWLLYLVRSADLNNILIKEVVAQGYWVIDNLFSPVVELDRCHYNGMVLKRGRLYYVDGFYNPEGLWIEKPANFKAWAKHLFTAARKSLVYDKKLGAYIGPEAALMRISGEVEFKSLTSATCVVESSFT
jgi:hypothetical protein